MREVVAFVMQLVELQKSDVLPSIFLCRFSSSKVELKFALNDRQYCERNV